MPPVSPLELLLTFPSFSTALRLRSRAPVEDPVVAGSSTQAGVKELASQLGKLRLSLERLQTSAKISTRLTKSGPERGFLDPDAVKQRLRDVGRELDLVSKHRFSDVATDLLDDIRAYLRASITDAFSLILDASGRSIVRSGFGIDFDFRDSSRGVFDFDIRKFNRSASQKFDKLNDFLFRDRPDGEQDGLVVSLIEALKKLEIKLVDALGLSQEKGLMVDLAI
jgi:hypothetical protein